MAYKAATAWFPRGKDYGLKCAPFTLNWTIFLVPTGWKQRGFLKARITGWDMLLLSLLGRFFFSPAI